MKGSNKIQTYYLHGLKEAPTLAKLIDPVLREAGFNTEDIESVQEEYEIKTELAAVEIDRCLKKAGKPVIFLQAKPVGRKDLFKVDYKKTFSAAKVAEVTFCIFTDGIYWEFYAINQSLEASNPQFLKRIEILYDLSRQDEVALTLRNLRESIQNEN